MMMLAMMENWTFVLELIELTTYALRSYSQFSSRFDMYFFIKL